MPLRDDHVRIDLLNCGPRGCWVRICVTADALRPLGLHPDQPTSRPTGVSPPPWWHAAESRGW
ncbi:hypothetical protein BBK82_36375 [Lentzea guizhouensis]|uniref:Uncharacterized protein n=1 Tax=Lentzea guizhouensis TaxID=1586287 RepID=A0A1B2HSD9_9PSEU|nr:hypothetical protein [Lentzea guizhouensis]ANZ40666.1 hypothetical protein BBK82_36375 [Lentzea guizhouensis]